MESITNFFQVGEEAEAIINSVAVLFFFGIFGYAYTMQTPVETEISPVDINHLTNKERNIFKKMITEIETTRAKINNVEDRMAKVFPDGIIPKDLKVLTKTASSANTAQVGTPKKAK